MALLLGQCVLQKAIKSHLGNCSLLLQNAPSSLESGYCSLFLTALHLAMHQFTPISSDYCWEVGGDFRMESMLKLGLQLIISCHLRNPDRYSACPSILRAGFKDVAVVRYYIGQAWSKIFLVLAGGLFQNHQRLNLSDMYWETEFRHSEELYRLSGKWDVNRECVTALQSVSVTVPRKVVVWAFGGIISEPGHVFQMKYSGILSAAQRLLKRWLPKLTPVFTSALRENSDRLLQRLLYPSFKRFLHHAKQRSEDNSNTVHVSCEGLHGNRNEVLDTTLSLLRLVIINELHHYNFSVYPAMIGTACNHFLPCFLLQAV